MKPEDNFDFEIDAMLADRATTMLEFTADYRPLIIYAIMRKDLEMDAGKLAAQTGHAYAEAIEHASQQTIADYKGTGHGTKITMTVDNLNQIKRIYSEARLAGIPVHLVIDRSHVILPHFTGQPIVTGVALGPVFKDEARFITKRGSLVK